MAPKTRTKAQVERDRIEVAKFYLQGKYQHEIASLLGISQQQVSFDLKAVQSHWRDVPGLQLTELKAQELARLDVLERTYWEAWADSKKPKETTSSNKDGDRIKVGKRNEQRNGNPAFLRGVMDCIAMRVRILGLDVSREDSTGTLNQSVMVYLPDNERNITN
ncbi:MAG: helix-turn-helix domain-containing protein [Chroococcidiopsis sp.]